VLDDAGAQPFEHGQDLVPHAGAEKAGIAVRGVDGVRERVAGDVRVDVGAAGAVKGADPVAIDGREGGEAAGTRATEDSHENGLGAVVGVVAGGDAVGAGARCRSA
jgi:hypothetical protein